MGLPYKCHILKNNSLLIRNKKLSELDRLFDSKFSFNKKFGQNFIFDGNLLRAIVADTKIDKDFTVLEIGTGAGTLTKEIATVAKKVITLEVDKNLKDYLNQTFSEFSNIELIFQDVMKVDLKELESKLGGKYVIVANLPYYITTPVIFKFIEGATNLQAMYVMVQLEVANRICAKPGTVDYGSITPIIDRIANAYIIRRVNRKMFVPSPKVDSAVVGIVFDENKYKIANKQLFSKVIKSVFAMRRKTLENNLKSTFAFTAQQIDEIFKACELEKGIRGEKLTTEQFVKLTNIIASMI